MDICVPTMGCALRMILPMQKQRTRTRCPEGATAWQETYSNHTQERREHCECSTVRRGTGCPGRLPGEAAVQAPACRMHTDHHSQARGRRRMTPSGGHFHFSRRARNLRTYSHFRFRSKCTEAHSGKTSDPNYSASVQKARIQTQVC